MRNNPTLVKPKKKHVPQRSCIICRRKTNKFSLFRLVLDEKGRVIFDKKQALPGRGAYVCPEQECVAKLLTKHGDKRLRYAFKGRFREIPSKTIDEILAALKPLKGGNG